VLVDVCRAVGIGNNRDVAAKLDADEKDAVDIADAIGRVQRTTIVNRPGLTKVLRDSRKPEAKAAADRFDRCRAGRLLGNPKGFILAHAVSPPGGF
jgi:hypothetical protein